MKPVRLFCYMLLLTQKILQLTDSVISFHEIDQGTVFLYYFNFVNRKLQVVTMFLPSFWERVLIWFLNHCRVYLICHLKGGYFLRSGKAVEVLHFNTTFLVKMSFIYMRMKNHFHIKGWGPGDLGNGLLSA